MKKILLPIFILCGFLASAQKPDGYLYQNIYSNMKAYYADSGFNAPVFPSIPYLRPGVTNRSGGIGIDTILHRTYFNSDGWRRLLSMLDTTSIIATKTDLIGLGGGSGETNTASNIGGGLSNFSAKVGVDLQFNTFTASDFNLGSNLFSIDYANGQVATNSVPGFLSAADYTTFAAKESALTFSTGLTRSVNTVTVNTSQNIATLSNLTSNGIIKTSGGVGTLGIAVAGDFPTLNQNTTGSAASLTTGRTIGITGDITYTSPSFNGTANVTAAGTLSTVNADVGSFTNASITVDAKGRITAASTGSSSGETNTASNLGGGLANWDSKSGVDLRFNTFTASDFNLSSNLLSIDYTNGQAASGSVKGFLTSADWTTFNSKQPGDADLTTIAGLTATTNNFIQSVGSAWASRTPTQATATLDVFTTSLKGLVPAPVTSDGTKVLHDDGTWSTPAAGGADETADRGLAETSNVFRLNDYYRSQVSPAEQSAYIPSLLWEARDATTRNFWQDGSLSVSINDTLFNIGGYTLAGAVGRINDTIAYSVDNALNFSVSSKRFPYAIANATILKARFPGDWNYILGNGFTAANMDGVIRFKTIWDFDTMTVTASYGNLGVFGAVRDEDGYLYVLGGQTASDSSTTTGDMWRSKDGGVTWTQIQTDVDVLRGNLVNAAQYRDGYIYIINARQRYDATEGEKTYTSEVYKIPVIHAEDGTKWKRIADAPAVVGSDQFITTEVFNGQIWVSSGNNAGNSNGIAYLDKNDVWHVYNNYTGIETGTPLENQHASSFAVHRNSLYRLMGSGTNQTYVLKDSNYLASHFVTSYIGAGYRTYFGETKSAQGLLAGNGVAPGSTTSTIKRVTDDTEQPFYNSNSTGVHRWGFLNAGNSTLNADVAVTTGQKMWLESVFGILKLSSNPSFSVGRLLQVDGGATFMNSVALNAGDLSVIQTGRVYLDGDAGGEYIHNPSSTDNIEVVLNSALKFKFNPTTHLSYRPIDYFANYGVDFTARSLVDKGYVDSAITAGGGGGGVTSVSGTADRVTSTGGATPVIDISSTFEDLLVKLAGTQTITGAKTFSAVTTHSAGITMPNFGGYELEFTNAAGNTNIYSLGNVLLNAGSAKTLSLGIGDGGTEMIITSSSITSSVSLIVPAETFGAGWNGDDGAATKNDIYDWGIALGTPVSSISVASANGFAGSSSGGATPALTLSTTVTGLLKGNGTAISAATSGTDYSLGTSALSTGILKSTTTTGALTIAVPGDFPTLNQSTTGSAATLTTGRTIGQTGDVVWTSASFDGSANVSGTATIQSNAITTSKINALAVTDAKINDVAVGKLTGITGTPTGSKFLRDDFSWQTVSGGSGTVTEVFGTANRITVATGTTTPVVDISATFEALLVKLAGAQTISGVKTFSNGIEITNGGGYEVLLKGNAAANFFSEATTPANAMFFNTAGGNIYFGNADGGQTLRIIGGQVGIDVAPTEAFHVAGNIRFSGALMPNNTAGTSGQVLTSAGAGAVPTWTTIAGGTGTVNTGAANKIAYYPGAGTTVDDLSDLEYISDGTNDHLKFFSSTKSVFIGARTSGTSYAGIWFGNITPSFTNYAFLNDPNSGIIIGAPSGQSIQYRVGNTNYFWLSASGGVSIGANNYNTDPGVSNLIVEGKIGIGVNGTPSEALHVTGNVRFSGALMPNNTAGTTGQVLTSAGAGAVPTWTTPSGGSYTTENSQDDFAAMASAEFTYTDGTPLLAINTIAFSKITGTVPIAQGGTNITTYTTGQTLYASATNVLSKRDIGATEDLYTVSGGVPVWSPPSVILLGQDGGTIDNTGTSETDLHAIVIAANRLDSDEESIDGAFSGTFNDNGATGQLRVYWGGNAIFNSGVLSVVSLSSWTINVKVMRTSSTTARAVVSAFTPGTTTAVFTVYTALTSQDFTSGITLKVTGQAGGGTGGSGDISSTVFKFFWENAIAD